MKNEKNTIGTVISVKKCWWIKINTKPVRRHATDGAVFPHILHVQYQVSGNSFEKRKYVSYRKSCPQPGDPVTVIYDEMKPSKCNILIN